MGRRAKIEETSANQISAMNYLGHLENETTPLSTCNLVAPMQINAMRAISSPRPAPTDQSSCVQLLIKLTFVLKDEGVSRSSWGALSLGLSDLHNSEKVKRLTGVLYHCDAIPAYCVMVISWNQADWKYCILLVFN